MKIRKEYLIPELSKVEKIIKNKNVFIKEGSTLIVVIASLIIYEKFIKNS